MEGADKASEHRLKVIHEAKGDEEGSITEFIAIHGLHSSFDKTWRRRLGPGDDDVYSWLPTLGPASRVFAYVGDLEFSSSESLLDRLALRRVATSLLAEISRSVGKGRPIVFLCHNVAGILVKEMLWVANQEADYMDVALDTKVLVLFGTPDSASDWENELLKLVLVTTEPSGDSETPTIQMNIRELIHKGPLALQASSLRYQMIQHQYQTIRIVEGLPTNGVGRVFTPPTGHGPDFEFEAIHSQLCCTSVLDLEDLINDIKRATSGPKKEHERQRISCRQLLGAWYRLSGLLREIHPGVSQSEVSTLSRETPTDWSVGITVIYGSPGSGKSILAGQIAHSASSYRSRKTVVLYFYFSASDNRRVSYRQMLLSLLIQLLYSEEPVMETSFVRRLASGLEDHRVASTSDLYRLFSAIVITMASSSTVLCVVDGLDECEEESRNQLMSDFKRMATQGLSSCRIILTCRPQPDIQEYLGPFTEDNSINLDEGMRQTSAAIMLKEMASDEFATLRDALQQRNATPLQVKLTAALGTAGASELADYGSIYKQLLERAEAPPLWLGEVLFCLAFAKRPLTVKELAAAMGVSAAGGFRQTLNTIRIASPKQLHQNLERVLGSLIRIENNVVHLIHGTMRDFLRDKVPEFLQQLETAPGTESNVDQQQQRRLLVLRKCLLTLEIPEISEMDASTLATGRQPFSFRHINNDHYAAMQPHDFACYAGHSLVDHMVDDIEVTAPESSLSTMDKLFRPFWDNTSTRSWWLRTFALPDLERSAQITKMHLAQLKAAIPGLAELKECTELDPDNLHELLNLAASLRLNFIVNELLSKNAAKLDKDNLISALGTAILNGDRAMAVQILNFADGMGYDLWLESIKLSSQNGQAKLMSSLLLHWTQPTNLGLTGGKILSQCLKVAAENGHYQVFSELLSRFPGSTGRLSKEQAHAMMAIAAQNGRDGAVEKILALAALGFNEPLPSPQTPVTDKAESNNEDGELTHDNDEAHGSENGGSETGEKNDEQEEKPPDQPQGDTWLSEALMAAAEFGSAATVRLLAQAGADLEYKHGWLGFTALHYAAADGNTEALEQLLAHGANVESLDDQDATPLLLAVLSEKVHTARCLLEKGANPDHAAAKSARYRALHLAARTGNMTMTRLLLEAGASWNVKLDPSEDTPLHLAVQFAAGDSSGGFGDTIRMLLRFDADIDTPNADGFTPLHVGVRDDDCSEKIIRLLVSLGADVDKLDNEDRSPLHYAVRNRNRPTLAPILWDPLGIVSRAGASVLFHAAAANLGDRVQQLIEAGCDKLEKDKWGRIPLDVAGLDKATRALLSPTPEVQQEQPEATGLDSVAKADPGSKMCSRVGKFVLDITYYCDSCGRYLIDELFYHCCDCSERDDCSGHRTNETCVSCSKKQSECKSKGHRQYARFVGGKLMSWEELTPGIFNFGVKDEKLADKEEGEDGNGQP